MDKNTIITLILIPIGVTIVSSGILAFFKWIKPTMVDNHLFVKEITKLNDKDINAFIQLYNRRINEEIRICAEQIVGFIDPNPLDEITHHLYVCKHSNEVVGFVKIIVSHKNNYLFIAYIAIDEHDSLAIKDGVHSMITKLIRKHLRGRNKVSNLFTEIERGSNNGYVTSLYKSIARRSRSFNFNAYVVDFDYIQPNMPDDSYQETNEKILSLIWIPCNESFQNSLSKTDVIKICKNIYEDIYLPSCNCSNDCSSYVNYLDSLYARYENNLPPIINVIPM